MNVIIAGAGAVGMLLSCLLQESGCRVTLLTRSKEQADLLNAEGIVKNGEDFRVKAIPDWEAVPLGAMLVLTVKYGDLAGLRHKLAALPAELPLVFLQNGMLHLQFAESLPQQQIAVGSVEHGAQKVSSNEVCHTGRGKVTLAVLRGEKEVFQPLLHLPYFPAAWHEDAGALLFRKVLLNCLINPLTAVLELKNGELLTNPHAFTLLQSIYKELSEAYPEMEHLLPFAQVVALCRSTAANTSSMLADRLSGRRLELDTIVGYTLKRAGQELPVLNTLYYLLKATEVD
ncbi:2-dehydropantoate 2-reductase [Planococcus lenghuensis]|uniref:2-dehydropantoate 2-reductase n=1 Tax=Planococcus lenghuensis TaxID=2213202 RepID=A0A1Q2L3S4_9BACL|nr:2-dehydropantoate 2-reductase [Planococcus lenghuensis]AQQ55115.1 hypothetical protein B0X71_12385 [Planococcus lenghuensis]